MRPNGSHRMKIVVAGPVATKGFSSYLPEQDRSAPRGLGGTAVTNLVAGMVERGDHVTVVSLDPTVTPGTEVVMEGERLRVRFGHYRARRRARDAFRDERDYVRDAVAAESPDLVHAHWQYEFALGALSTGLPTLVTCHDWAPAILRQMPDGYRMVRLGMQVATFRRARFLTAVSPPLRDQVARWTSGVVDLVPNAVPESFFREEGRTTAPGSERLLAVNLGFSARKNVGVLLQAFAILRRTHPQARLVLVGPDYEHGGPAARWAGQRELSGGVTFVGPVSNDKVRRLLHEADVFVHPSHWEACPMVLIEAMAQGLPVVGGERSGGVPWMLQFGDAGVLTDVSSPDRLASAIREVMDSPPLRQELSAAARARAAAEFHPASVLARYDACYERVLAVG
jgi:L-malate glycosyltransferase